MILWRNIENYHFLSFLFRPQISPILLYVGWKSGVTFVRRCFRDVEKADKIVTQILKNAQGRKFEKLFFKFIDIKVYPHLE